MYSNQSSFPMFGPEAVSHLAALALLGTVFVCGAALFAAVVLRLTGRPRGATITALVAPGALALYAVALFGVSFASRDRVMGRGDEKYFCELDCHLAYAVMEVRAAASLGDSVQAPPAQGGYWLVTVRARFDSTTTAPWRPRDIPVKPDPRELVLLDRAGREYTAATAAQAALDRAQASLSPLTRALLPGQAAFTRVVFDLPAGARPSRALLRDTELFHRFVIADEVSLLHRQTFWGL